jgi:hypothetical protein
MKATNERIPSRSFFGLIEYRYIWTQVTPHKTEETRTPIWMAPSVIPSPGMCTLVAVWDAIVD